MVKDLSPSDLRSILEFSITIALKAGAVILQGSEAIQSVSDIGEKTNSVDLVTEFDVKVEELLKAEIGREYPDFKFIGEESFIAGSRLSLTEDPTFCVDPIDGTTNFVHGFSWVCTSIGLIYKRRPVLGVIYNPFSHHLYTAVQGQGAHLTIGASAPRKLPLAQPKPLPSLHHATIAIEWGANRAIPAITAKSDSFRRLAGDPAAGTPGGCMVHSLRSVGSGALNCALVAQGAIDAYWEIGPWPWDVCAGIVIAQEAGCAMTGSHSAALRDEPFDVTEDVLLGRKFLLVRALPTTTEETSVEAQKRLVKEFYEAVIDFEP